MTPSQLRAPRAPLRIDVFFSFATMGQMMISNIVGSWLLYRYLPPEGKGTVLVPAAWFGAVLLISRVVDALVDPPIGYLSDHTHTRWGRRLPFMAAAGLPTVILFVLIWNPPLAGESWWNLLYVGGALCLYNFVHSVFTIPFNALIPEITSTESHRVRIAAFYSGSQLLGIVLAAFAGNMIKSGGYRTMALVYAGIALVLLYVPFLVLRERPERQIPRDARLGFFQSLRIVLRNQAFRYWIATWTLYWIAATFIQSIIPFVATEICLASEAEAMLLFLPAALVSLACYPLVVFLARRVGKWRVFTGSLLAGVVFLPMLFLIGDWLPVPLLIQGVVWISLEAIALSGTTVLPTAFGAEVVDYDRECTGQCREGIYYASWGLLDQIVNGIAMAFLPLILLLGRSHTDPRGPLGVRMVGVVGSVMLLAAFLIFRNYPLRHRGTRNDGAGELPAEPTSGTTMAATWSRDDGR